MSIVYTKGYNTSLKSSNMTTNTQFHCGYTEIKKLWPWIYTSRHCTTKGIGCGYTYKVRYKVRYKYEHSGYAKNSLTFTDEIAQIHEKWKGKITVQVYGISTTEWSLPNQTQCESRTLTACLSFRQSRIFFPRLAVYLCTTGGEKPHCLALTAGVDTEAQCLWLPKPGWKVIVDWKPKPTKEKGVTILIDQLTSYSGTSLKGLSELRTQYKKPPY